MPSDPSLTPSNPPIELAVAAWLGMPDDEIRRGLDEGWIRGPQPPAPVLETIVEQSEPQPALTDPPVDRDRVHALLRRLDGSLTQATFDTAWSEAGSSDAARAERLTSFVARALGCAADDVPAIDALEALASTMSGAARFVRLAGQSGEALANAARADAGMRVALAQHAPWAFTGDRVLTARADPHGRFDRYDPQSGELLLSDDWIGDRARHAAWRQAAQEGRSLEVDGASWRFVDRMDAEASLELKGDDGAVMHQVVFARDSGDTVSGGATTDRIHGGDGDDVLRGRAGEDLLEGGRGEDVLLGGSGRDDLAGQQGNDELDGGAGDDRIDGGSGDDELAGGRGDDLLRGGAGADRYVFDAGDGLDTIQDADGGELVIDDALLSGTLRRTDDGWADDGSNFAISLEGSLAAGGTLVIRRSGAQGEGIRIEGWRQGSFGLTLAGDEDDVASNPSGRDAWHTEGGDAATVASYGTEGASGIAEADAGVAPQALEVELAALDGDAAGEPALVDLDVVSRALGEWAVPEPPDPGAFHLDNALSESAVADAMAADDASFADDGATYGGSFGEWTSLPLLPTLADVPVPVAPSLQLRRS